jgi:hypothetical protein
MSKQWSIYAGVLLVGISFATWTDFNPWVALLWSVAVVLVAWGLLPD